MIFFILIGIFLIFSGTSVSSEGEKGPEKPGGDKGKSG
jgi:hypothetical protein